MRTVRTNSDIEGWHHGLNLRAAGRCGLPFYMLVQLLHNKAKLADLQIRFVSEKKLRRIQRKNYHQSHERLFSLWEALNRGEKSVRQLLKACAHMNAPKIG